MLNPTNAADDGFRLLNANNPLVTLPVELTPYGGSTYYIEAEPFPTYYQTSGVYPSNGVISATLGYGTQVYDKMNYLDFSLTFSRNDINGLVLEIPTLTKGGSFIFNDPSLLGLGSGSEYPCSVGIGLNVFCFYEIGSTSGYGRPIRIHITKFAIQAGNTLSLRLLF